MAIVDKALKRLSNANIATFVIMGNHDYKRNGDSFTSSITSLAACEYPNVRMLLEPEVVQVCSVSNERVNLLLLPYRDRRMYPGEDSRLQSAAYDEYIKSEISSIDNEFPTISVGHNFFYEGSYNDYGGSELMVKPNSFRGCDVAMMGHLHQFRVLRKSSPVCIYTGSMERSNFGDAAVDKYFIDYNINRKKAKFCKIPSRGLVDATENLSGLDFSDITEALDRAIDSYNVSGKIIRFKVIADEKVLPAIDRASIQSALYDNGAFHVSKVIIEAISKRVVRDNSVLKHKDDFSMFKAFLESQEIPEEYRKLLLEETQIIMGE